ncbi:Hypothetical Protein FCC1311_007102 [Hondaea fermentalgiana]|uniref:Uncharacterized protein n=1 Tax=Hondaea fermentalgiana TaxID=2315210 RepID=A0A2R5G0F2_9STRA|nr:Hypothetical Protein FCC1311_007102 [Hondaea fermentalgiana]|eukprot:GBG24492.1 Hypothetical Protein FCC1311_007102 [Hondaea fermentalgiana]
MGLQQREDNALGGSQVMRASAGASRTAAGPAKDPRTEDLGLEDSLRLQVEHSQVATAKLNALERAQVLKDLPKGKPREQTLLHRIDDVANRHNFPTFTEHDASARLDFEDILRLLLASLQGRFASGVHRQKCGSPVPFNGKTAAYETIFYVSKERKLAKLEENGVDIPVRYQGFNKSTVWFSESMPHWGIVARRMQHQARMKQKQAHLEADMATKSSLFFHVFEGFSYVLLRRDDPEIVIPKAQLAKYIVEDAAKIVHIWPLARSRAGHNASLSKTANALRASVVPLASLSAAIPPARYAAESSTPSSSTDVSSLGVDDGASSASGKRSFYDLDDLEPSSSELNDLYGSSNRKRGRKSQGLYDPLPATSSVFGNSDDASHESSSARPIPPPPASAPFGSFQNSATLDLNSIALDEAKLDDEDDANASRGYSAAGNTNYDDPALPQQAQTPGRNAGGGSAAANGDLDVYDFFFSQSSFANGIDDDALSAVASLAGSNALASLYSTGASRPGSASRPVKRKPSSSSSAASSIIVSLAAADTPSFVFEHKSNDDSTSSIINNSNKPVAAPAGPSPFAAPVPDAEETHKSLSEDELVSDIDGSALAKHLLQTLSNGMDVLQYANDYSRICHTLFETDVPRYLRRAILQHDCRVDPDFLYPRFTSFVEGIPIGTVRAVEDPARLGLHMVEFADETARHILRRNPVGMTNFIGTLDLSDATSVMARYYRVRFGNSREWFHRVITINGRQIVLRCHSKAKYKDSGSLAFVTQIQDVTFLYPETQGCRPLP